MHQSYVLREIYTSLRDVELPTMDIEEGIADLVRALLAFGIKTTNSCEGHLEKSKDHCPWIAIDTGASTTTYRKRYRAVRRLVKKYNKEHEQEWRFVGSLFCPYVLRPKVSATNEAQLYELQLGAADLAQYLFEQRVTLSKKLRL